MITRDEVLKVLHYDEFSGIFTWKAKSSPRATRVKISSEAGCVAVEGGGKPYRIITITGRQYKAHRLAWLLITGSFPNAEIDHIDGCGLNNASSNLRAVTRKQNSKNARKQVRNTSGCTGVHWDNASAKWMARISFDGKRKSLGLFESFDDALAVRKEHEKKLGYHPNHGTERPL